jgi:hypothetical protein
MSLKGIDIDTEPGFLGLETIVRDYTDPKELGFLLGFFNLAALFGMVVYILYAMPNRSLFHWVGAWTFYYRFYNFTL